MEMLTEILSCYQHLKSDYHQEECIELLREIQAVYGCISPEIQMVISEQLQIGLPVIRTLIKRYPTLKEQSARHRITVCTGRQCHNKGCGGILEKIEKETGASAGETTRDGCFQIQTQCCLKHCSTAPNLRIDDDIFTAVDPRDIPQILRKYC